MEEATSAPVRARYSRLQLGIAALSAAFAALAALVASGHLDAIDHHALVHWMPALDPSGDHKSVPPLKGAIVPFGTDASWWKALLELVMWPASIAISLALFAFGSLVLWRRGARVAAVVWGATWFVVNAAEAIVKVAIAKPALYATEDGVAYHVASFDHSFPSGHAVRSVLVAGLVAYVWPRFGWAAAAWAAVVGFCLVPSAWHVPSDIVGGVVFGMIAVLSAHAVIGAVSARRA
jgi:membrane-associated phospholipid phosphatase